MIKCTKCGKQKQQKEFPLNGDGRGGYRKQCKECMQTINKAWRKKNKQKVAQYNKNRPKRTESI